MSKEIRNPDFDRGFNRALLGVTQLEIARMPSEELASWQSQQQPGSPQYILADQEWQNRRLIRQLRAAYVAAILGLVGVVLGWYLRSLLPINQLTSKADDTQIISGTEDGQNRQERNQAITPILNSQSIKSENISKNQKNNTKSP